jgi:hypothetical protein
MESTVKTDQRAAFNGRKLQFQFVTGSNAYQDLVFRYFRGRTVELTESYVGYATSRASHQSEARLKLGVECTDLQEFFYVRPRSSCWVLNRPADS